MATLPIMTMESLRQLQTIIFYNSNALSEGDYIDAMNAMKELFDFVKRNVVEDEVLDEVHVSISDSS